MNDDETEDSAPQKGAQHDVSSAHPREATTETSGVDAGSGETSAPATASIRTAASERSSGSPSAGTSPVLETRAGTAMAASTATVSSSQPHSTSHAARVDYAAAMNEAMSNLEVRRLMLVLTNVLTPACVMAVTDCLAGSNVAASFSWLPRLVLPICGALLLATGFLVTGVLARCHFGLVVNGTKLHMVETGKLVLAPLNWLGVTTNFLIITAMSTALGALALCAGLGLGSSSWIAAAVVLVAVLAWLPSSHARANRACQEFSKHWQTADIPVALREEHTRKSLDATSSDISVVVVMAAALFAGLFNALTNLGGIRPTAGTTPPVDTIQSTAPVVLLGFAFVSLFFSCRILVRLRIAFGEHSQRLAALRDETDTNAMRWRAQERTYLLYAIVLVLLTATGIMLGYDRAGPIAGLTVGGLAFVAGLAWYPATLRAARHRRT